MNKEKKIAELDLELQKVDLENRKVDLEEQKQRLKSNKIMSVLEVVETSRRNVEVLNKSGFGNPKTFETYVNTMDELTLKAKEILLKNN